MRIPSAQEAHCEAMTAKESGSIKTAKESAVSKDTRDGRYYHIVAERMKLTKGWRSEMDQLEDGSLPDHVASVFDFFGGGLDPVKRMAEVENAVRRQQEIQKEKRERKKERMKSAVRKANDQIGEGGLSILKEETQKPSKLMQAVSAAMARDDNAWTEVNSFKTKEEAVVFIMECQPFSFAPILDPTDDPIPKFETCHEAAAYVSKMHPVPMTYVSTVNDFKRRLRIRLVDVEENDSKTRLLSVRSKRRTSASRVSTTATTPVAPAQAPKPKKPWLVEASGTFFTSPSSLRGCREPGTKYYLAVAQDTAQTIQQEGYRVQKRCSIPLSATPQEALLVWARNNQKPNRKDIPKATVLTVVVPMEMEIVAHRQQGFLVRTKELPASCFRVKKTGPAGAGDTS